jgi:Protein of unknown function (DUF2924)
MNAKLQLVRRRELIDVRLLAPMNTNQIRRLHRDVFGSAVPFCNSEQAKRRIARKIQAEREGGLPDAALQRALAIGRETDLRIQARLGKRRIPLAHAGVTRIVSNHDPRLPMPGTVLVKEYRGRTIQVQVLDSGFEFDGRRFTSLSAIATDITGTKWNGMAFFGLGDVRRNGK